MKPIIGITPSAQLDELAHGTFQRYCLSAPYVRAIAVAGGIPLILPPQRHAADGLMRTIDGLLLSGGPDIDPVCYGDHSIHPKTYGIDPERDHFEFELFAAALKHEIPVFGICRGIQVINVALGGTLIQDVGSEHAGAADVGHRQHKRGLQSSAVGHTVRSSEPALLPIFDDDGLGVNSFHHQAIRDLAPQLVPVAYSPDGLIEAVILPGETPVFAVQWHPELMFEHDAAHVRPFIHLVKAATVRRLTASAV